MEDVNILSDEEEDLVVPEESKISKTLSDKTTRTVVLLVLSLLFMLQICSMESYVSPVLMHEQALKHLVSVYNDKSNYPTVYKEAFDHLVSVTRELENYKLIFIRTPTTNSTVASANLALDTYEWQPWITSLRKDSYASVVQTADDGHDFILAYSTQDYAVTEAIINISRTLFVCAILSVASIYFTKDA